MRGKRFAVCTVKKLLRNIPAYAGKTSIALARHSGVSEHPRVCGENQFRLSVVQLVTGTSPRMRGKPGTQPTIERDRRNIPAYAGKTQWNA